MRNNSKSPGKSDKSASSEKSGKKGTLWGLPSVNKPMKSDKVTEKVKVKENEVTQEKEVEAQVDTSLENTNESNDVVKESDDYSEYPLINNAPSPVIESLSVFLIPI